MKNLDQRIEAARGRLWCPYANADSESYDADCIKGLCAHYNPDTHECVHVEAAMAQVRAAEALTGLYSLLKQKEAGHECY